jgi:hypothetical protein
MSWNSTLGLVALIALALPIILMIVLRLATYRTFPALLFLLAITFAQNLLNLGYIQAPQRFIREMNFWNNMLDAPLMIMFLTYLSSSLVLSKTMKWGILAFFLFEVAVIVLAGYNVRAITIILGPGLAFVFGFCLHFFIRNTKITIMHKKASGKAIIAAALLFAYGCYSLIYLMYYVMRTPHIADTFLVYYLSVIFSSLLLSAGIIVERKRIQKLNELKLTRKELSLLYQDSKPQQTFRAVFGEIQNDRWN